MKTTTNFFNFLTLFLLVALLSCEKEVPEPSIQELISKKWNVGKITRNGQEVTSSLSEVEFSSNKSFSFNLPSILELPQNGTWSLSSSNDLINLNPTAKLKILGKVEKNKLELEYKYTNHKMGEMVVILYLN